MQKLIVGLLGIFITWSAFADVAVSVTGTAESTTMGYAAGQSYTFTWVVNAGYTWSPMDTFDTHRNSWWVENTDDPLLWSAVYGDGLVGSYARPSVSSGAPYDVMESAITGFRLLASNDDPDGSQGITVNGVEMKEIDAGSLNIGSVDYSETHSLNPAAWLNDYVGTYAQSGATGHIMDENGSYTSFNWTSATVEAVPEPATFSLVALLGGGLLFIRRRFYC